MTAEARTLHWAHGEATLLRAGAMLAPVRFRAAGQAEFSPLHVAPWANELGLDALPRALRLLRGDWPCAPFGRCDRPDGLPASWFELDPGDAWGHGYPLHHDWQWLDAADPLELALALDVPPPSPLARIERRVRADPQGCALTTTLSLEARSVARLPFALHPTFSLAQGRVALRVPGFRAAHAYPVAAEAGVSRLLPGARFASLAAAPGLDGPLDLGTLPLPFRTEELLQLQDPAGPIALDYLDAGWRVELDWPRALLPDAMLWISNGGRSYPPWSSRHYALGVEPLNGLFDLGRVAAADAAHPLAARRGVALVPDTPLEFSYELRAAPL